MILEENLVFEPMHACHLSIVITTCTSDDHKIGPVYTMDHEVGPWKMAFFHGPISFKKKQIYKVFEPLTRCKPSVDQEQ